MIWSEIAQAPQMLRFEMLSAELRACGVEQSFEPFALAGASLEEKWPLINAKAFAQLRIEPAESLGFEGLPLEIPRQVNAVGSADAFVKDASLNAGHRAKNWVARNFFFDAIVELMALRVKNLDFTGDVLIIGSGVEARALVFALSQVGFTRMTIASGDTHQASELLAKLKRSCFGVTFSPIPLAGLTQLAATKSIAVNTLALAVDDPLITELSYFNFIKPNGVWLETTHATSNSPLVEEARELALQTISPLDVMSLVDALWARACFDVAIDLERYRRSWAEKLR